MGIREALQTRKLTATAIWSCIVFVALGVIIWELQSSKRSTANNSFFTVDDGKTWFTGDLDQVPPFDYNGKQAVRCFVYQAQGGKPFVGYMLKYNPTTKSSLEKATPEEREQRAADLSGALLKRPGEAEWISGTDRNASAMIRSVVGPAGETDALPIFP